MAIVTFDTHNAVLKLKLTGFKEEQAEEIVRVISESQGAVVTRDYLDSKLNNELSPVRVDIAVLKWMNGITISLCLSILLKLFL